MKHLLYLLILANLLIINACTLSGEQENKLNNQLNGYIKAFNKRNTLVLTAQTHHAVVSHYLKDTIESFDIHFNQVYDTAQVFFENPLNRSTKSEGNYIQRKYSVEKFTTVKEINPEYYIFAVSEDNGNTWFFVTEEDYFNPKIKMKHLFNK